MRKVPLLYALSCASLFVTVFWRTPLPWTYYLVALVTVGWNSLVVAQAERSR